MHLMLLLIICNDKLLLLLFNKCWIFFLKIVIYTIIYTINHTIKRERVRGETSLRWINDVKERKGKKKIISY